MEQGAWAKFIRRLGEAKPPMMVLSGVKGGYAPLAP